VTRRERRAAVIAKRLASKTRGAVPPLLEGSARADDPKWHVVWVDTDKEQI